MNFPWSKSASARDRATADAASSSSKMTSTTNPSVSQQQLGNGTAASVQQQRASLLPQERAPVAHVGVREDAGALLLLQQQHQQAQLGQQQRASLGQQERASLGQQERASSVPVQQQRAPVAQVGNDEDVFDNEVSQLTCSIAFEDPFFESSKSRSTVVASRGSNAAIQTPRIDAVLQAADSVVADSQTIDPVFQTPVASSNNNKSFTTTNVNLIGSRPSSQSGSRPPSRSHSRSSSQIGSRPPSRNHSRHSSEQRLPSTPRGTALLTTNTNDDNFFDDDFAQDAEMNHLFEDELLDGTMIGETQQDLTPTLDTVAPDFEGVNPDCIMQRLKQIKPEILIHLKLKPFYKSYCSWEKLSTEQRNKTVSFFRKLPEQLRGTVYNFKICFICFLNVI
jgi:hypothetical protein